MTWTVIVPVKRLEVAKSRLRGAVSGVAHEALVLAMAMDTVAAALASPAVDRVLVVSVDRVVAGAASRLGAQVLPDVPDAGLNPALTYAASLLAAPGPASASLAALPGDLPAMRSDELTAALRAADLVDAHPHRTGTGRAFVADAAGSGTVLLAARAGAALEPRFGGGSAAGHAASGAVALTGDWPSLRRDVDTATDLADAARLGLGRHTLAVLGPALVG